MGLDEILEEINKVVENLNYKNSIKFIEELERLEERGNYRWYAMENYTVLI